MKKFRLYSIIALAATLVLCLLTGVFCARIKADAANSYFSGVYVTITDSTVLKYIVTVPEGYTQAEMKYTYSFGDTETTETGVLSEDGKSASFSFDKITPEFYAESIKATLTLTGDGKGKITEEKTYSIVEYLRSLLDRDALSLGLSKDRTAALRKLTVDMLYLGDEAQDYVANGAPVEKYATSVLKAEEKALRSTAGTATKPDNYKSIKELNTDDSKVFYISRGAEFTSKIVFTFGFTVKGEEGEITVKAGEETVNAENKTFVLGSTPVEGYYVKFDKTFAEVYGQDITFEVYAGETKISEFEYGLNHFRYAFAGDEKVKSVVDTAYCYGVSAAEYDTANKYDFYAATRNCTTSGTVKDYYYNPENGLYYEETDGDAVTPEIDIANHEKTVDNTWHTCEVCGKEYLSTRSGGGNQNSGRKKYVLLPGKDVTLATSYVEFGTESDYITSYNVKEGSPQTYTFNLPEKSGDKVLKVYVNMRNTNQNANKTQNLEYQLNKTLHLYVGSIAEENEITVSDDVVLKAGVEGCNTYFCYELATIALPENQTIILQFTYPGENDGSGKAKGGYLCYLSVEESDASCDEGFHTLKTVSKVLPTCTEDGHEAYYECAVCGKIFEDAKAQNLLSEIPVMKATNVHVWDEPRYKDVSTHTLTCLSCGTTLDEMHEHSDAEKHLIVAKAPSKVWYVAGETLDTDRMELYLSDVCAKGCKNSSKVGTNDYTVEYDNGNAFSLGDTSVTLKHTASGSTVKLPVYVTEEGKTITVDNKDSNFALSGVPNDGVRADDQGGKGQSGYGGSYVSSLSVGSVATIRFNLESAQQGRIVLQASSNRTVKGSASEGNPEYTLGMCVNDVMVITVNGEKVFLSYESVLKGCVSNLEASSNRWVWTNWTSVDLGVLNLKEGENIVKIEFISTKDFKNSYNNVVVVGQLDCMNVFLD